MAFGLDLGSYGQPIKPKNWCHKHRRYEAKRKPTSTCVDCWRYFFKIEKYKVEYSRWANSE